MDRGTHNSWRAAPGYRTFVERMVVRQNRGPGDCGGAVRLLLDVCRELESRVRPKHLTAWLERSGVQTSRIRDRRGGPGRCPPMQRHPCSPVRCVAGTSRNGVGTGQVVGVASLTTAAYSLR